jgi:hypothetical protein
MQRVAVLDRQVSGARPRTAWGVALTACSLGGAVSVLKGLAPRMAAGSEFYWMFSYEYGFLRRALLGTLVHPLLSRLTFEHLAPWITAVHAALCFGIIGACQALFRRALNREESFDTRTTLLFAYLCLMCSQWLPTLAHDVGYVDVYLVALVLAGFTLIVQGRYVTASLMAMIGPLIHEAFFFLWSPVALVLAYSCVMTRTDIRKKLLAATLPVASTVAVTFFQSDAAASRAINDLPVSQGIKDGLRAYEIGQTLQSSFHEMVPLSVSREFQPHRNRGDLFSFAQRSPSLGGGVLLWKPLACAMDDIAGAGRRDAFTADDPFICVGPLSISRVGKSGCRHRFDRVGDAEPRAPSGTVSGRAVHAVVLIVTLAVISVLLRTTTELPLPF